MIRISVGNGRTVSVKTLDEALNFDFQEALADNRGYEINDPFDHKPPKLWDEDPDDEEEEIVEDTFLLEILDISDIDELEINVDDN